MSKTVLITGCSTGIGKALAEEFHRKGDKVFATARKLSALDSLKEQGMEVLQLDVNDSDSLAAAAATLGEKTDHLDILINNAGYASMGPVLEIPREELQRQFETNVFSPIYVTQSFLPLLKKSAGAQVANIGSVSGVLTTPFAGVYCATKSALHSLSDAMRMELAPFNIKVMIVQPGAIKSEFGNTAAKVLDEILPSDSDYNPIRKAIEKRANASQKNPTPAADFANELREALQKKSPKEVVRIGNGSKLLPIIARWLPTSATDKALSRSFQLHRLNT